MYYAHQFSLQTQFYNITGLDPYQMVTVTITATTGGGTSNRSKEEFGRTSEAGKLVQCYSLFFDTTYF